MTTSYGLRTFNSVGGFSVGNDPGANVIYGNGDVTLGTGSIGPGSDANIYLSGSQGNIFTGGILTDNIYHANGVAYDFSKASGSSGSVQFSNGTDLTSSTYFNYNTGTETLSVPNLDLSGNITINVIFANTYASFDGQTTLTLASGWANTSGNANVSGNIVVYGNGIFGGGAVSPVRVITLNSPQSGDVTVVNNLRIGSTQGNLLVNGFANITGNANINLDANVVGNANVGTNLNVAQNANIQGWSNVAGNMVGQSNLFIAGYANVTGDVNVGNTINPSNVKVAGWANVTGDIVGQGELVLTGNAKVNTNLIANGDMTIKGWGNIYGDGNIGGNLLVAGWSNVTGNIVGQAELQITGNANITKNINGSANLAITKNGNILGNLNVGNTASAGAGNISVNGWSNVTGNIVGQAELQITGNANITANTNVTGTANVGNLLVQSGGLILSNLIPNIGPGTGDAQYIYNLGNSTHRFKDLWLSATTLNIGSVSISDVSGSLTTTNANFPGNVIIGTPSVSPPLNGTLTVWATTAMTDLTLSGNLTVGGTTTYVNTTTTAIEDPVLLLGGAANGANLSTSSTTDTGLYLYNYYGGAPTNQFLGWKTSTQQFEAYANATILNNVVSEVAYANIKANIFFGNLTGSLNTASQPNITSLGNLTSLQVGSGLSNVYIDGTGNITAGGTVNVNKLIAGPLTFTQTDGTTGQVLTTDGAVTVGFTTIDTHQIQLDIGGPGLATSNAAVYSDGNVTVSISNSTGTAVTSNVFVVSSSGANVTGNLDVTNTLTAGSFSVGAISLQGSLVLGNTVIYAQTTTTTSITSNQMIAQIPTINTTGAVSNATAVEFFVKSYSSTQSKFSVATISAVTDGTNIDFMVYGTASLGGTNGTFNVALNGSTGNIELQVTPSSGQSIVWTTQSRTI